MTSAVSRLHQGSPRRSPTALPPLHPRIDHLLAGAEIDRDHLVSAGLWLGLGSFVAFVASLVFGLRAGVVVVVVVASTPAIVLVRWSGRRDRHLVEALPGVVDMIARSLRSGLSLGQAVHEVADTAAPAIAPELRRIVDDMGRGHSLVTAVGGWVNRSHLPEVRVVGAAIALATTNEAGATRALDGVSQSLRDRHALDGEIRVLTAQSSASTRALVGLPICFLALDALAGQHALGYLVTNPLGRSCLVAGLSLDAVGWWWMRSIVKARMS